MRKEPLKVQIENGLLTISIGIETMCNAVEYGLTATFGETKITDHDVFSSEVLHNLTSEEEDGTTPVHKMFDQSAFDAIENGADGVEIEDA